MAVSQADLQLAQGDFDDIDFDIVDKNPNDEVTAVVVTIRGINGSKSVNRRGRPVDYRLLADVSDLASGLPEAWIVLPQASQIEHVNIWPAAVTCPLTQSRMPRICWGKIPEDWRATSPGNRTLGRFLEMAHAVLNDVNLLSPAR